MTVKLLIQHELEMLTFHQSIPTNAEIYGILRDPMNMSTNHDPKYWVLAHYKFIYSCFVDSSVYLLKKSTSTAFGIHIAFGDLINPWTCAIPE